MTRRRWPQSAEANGGVTDLRCLVAVRYCLVRLHVAGLLTMLSDAGYRADATCLSGPNDPDPLHDVDAFMRFVYSDKWDGHEDYIFKHVGPAKAK
jgi:hypothetical protein